MNITHKRLAADVRKLADKIKAATKYGDIKFVYGIPRGGTSIAVLLAEELKAKVIVDPRNASPKDTLVVDDLCDSGSTLKPWNKAGYKTAVVYAKEPSKAIPMFVGSVTKAGEWIVLPDEGSSTIEDNATRILEYIGEDPTREGLIETPKRMRKAWDEIFSGYKTDPKSLVKTFTKGTCKEMVILKNSEFYSTCEHHFFPFFGHCSIGYIPNGKVIGVSKLARLLDCFSKRMQIQERMTAQIADFLMEELGALGVYVICEGVHFCMTSRGVKKQNASMVTSAIRGKFLEDSAMRNEFLHLIGK